MGIFFPLPSGVNEYYRKLGPGSTINDHKFLKKFMVMMPLRKEKKKNFVQNKGVGRQACCARRNN
jgi:hypothetical protein